MKWLSVGIIALNLDFYFFALVVIVPETHADLIRDAFTKRGAGESECYLN